MDDLRPRRRRLSSWVVVVLAVIINVPVLNHASTQQSIARSGVEVQATLVDAARAGEGDASDYGVAFRFDEGIDPAQTVWTSEVDRVAYQRALDTESVRVRVLADRPAAYRVDGAITTRLGWYVTGVADLVLIAGVLLLRRGGRHRVLRLVALEDVRRHEPGSGPQTGLEDLGGATYLLTGEVTWADAEEGVVTLDTGRHQVRVALGAHTNLVGYQQPGRVTARLPE